MLAVVGVADGADRRVDAGLDEPVGEGDGGVLGAGDALLLVKGGLPVPPPKDGMPVLGAVKVVHPVGCSTLTAPALRQGWRRWRSRGRCEVRPVGAGGMAVAEWWAGRG
jgi:hypothetical protein